MPQICPAMPLINYCTDDREPVVLTEACVYGRVEAGHSDEEGCRWNTKVGANWFADRAAYGDRVGTPSACYLPRLGSRRQTLALRIVRST